MNRRVEAATEKLRQAQQALIDLQVDLATRASKPAFQAALKLRRIGWSYFSAEDYDGYPEDFLRWQDITPDPEWRMRDESLADPCAMLGLDYGSDQSHETLRYLANLTEEDDDPVLELGTRLKAILAQANGLLSEVWALRFPCDTWEAQLEVGNIDPDRKTVDLYPRSQRWYSGGERPMDLCDVRPILRMVKQSLRSAGWRRVRLVGFEDFPRTAQADLKEPVTVVHYLAGADLP